MKTFRSLLITCVLSWLCLSIYAQRVDTVLVHSAAMNKDIPNLVILPDGYEEGAPDTYPVLYLLHGHGGSFKSWLRVQPELPRLASEKGMIVVCPDGKSSWYWDSPVDPAVRYETYVGSELVSYMDANYSTRKSSGGRAIAGFSMGGHGALWLAIRHPDVFGACGAMSGGVDIRPFPGNWEMSKSLGAYKDFPERWNRHTVINLVSRIKPGSPAIIFDCGTEDFFYKVNEELHRKLLYYNIPHDYISRPGAHTSAYWKNALSYQLVFFDGFFRKE